MSDMHNDEHFEDDPLKLYQRLEGEDPLAMLLRLEDEQNAKMRAQAREKLETQRSVQRTLDEEERRRSHDMTRVGSYTAAAALQREADRKERERRDAAKRRAKDRAAFKDFYGIDLDE